MGREIEVEAVRRETIDVHGCVLALLALAQQLADDGHASDMEPGAEVDRPEAGDG